MIYREAARKLAALGCREVPRRGGGAHRKWQNPATNRSTVPSPMPEQPPVIRATLPSRRPGILISPSRFAELEGVKSLTRSWGLAPR